MTSWRARLKFELGDWQGAGEDALKVLQNCATTVAMQAPALIVLGQLRTRRGDPQASAALDEARTLVGLTRELQRIVPLTVASAEAAWLAGDPAAAVAELLPVYERARARSRSVDERRTGCVAAATGCLADVRPIKRPSRTLWSSRASGEQQRAPGKS